MRSNGVIIYISIKKTPFAQREGVISARVYLTKYYLTC